MPAKPVLRMGNPVLLKQSAPVENFDTPSLHDLIMDMRDTMEAMSGAGIAAPQIGVSSQVVIFGVESSPRYPDAPSVPFTVLVNPTVEPLTEETEDGWEGCLSVPGMRGVVPRFKRIRYSGFDQYGNAIDREVDGFHARVVQHECDHLNGILYPMRIRDLRTFGFNAELFPDESFPDPD
jgi:peptide deformylase